MAMQKLEVMPVERLATIYGLGGTCAQHLIETCLSGAPTNLVDRPRNGFVFKEARY